MVQPCAKGSITATGKTSSKTGSSCANTIIGLINQDNASIEVAKTAGGIVADYQTKGFHPFVGETCVTFSGKLHCTH
ncbi:MAG: TRL-like family protein [Pseudomonadales bacterium]|nr:TRL-like family protein [Pseudomonadales bacterium]